MRGDETLEQLVARINASAYIPHTAPLTGAITRRPEMAKVVKLKGGKTAEDLFAQGGGGGGVSKYPWDAWLDGQLQMIEKDEGDTKKDFDVETDAMPAKLKTAARRRYKVVQISRKDADGKKLENALIIRARDMDADERAAEDITRAEEKEANKARRAEAAAEANGTAAS